MRPFNLLSHPGLAQQRRVFHRWWTSGAGVLVGCLLAWSWQQWQMAETQRLQLAHSHLQSEWLDQMQRAKDAAQQQLRQRMQMEQALHLQRIAMHQEAWMAVHERMQDMAKGGLSLSRLNADADHVAWHGEFSRFESMAAARQSLSEQLGQDLALKDMSMGPASQVGFVWQTTWPALLGARLTHAETAVKAKP
jgi:hypothetical protein